MDDIIKELNLDSGMTPADYWYYKGLKERTLILNDEVTENIVEDIILPMKQMEKEYLTVDAEAQTKIEPIHLYINSIGGSVLDGMVLCDFIDTIQCPLVVEVLGCAMSMGMHFLAAGGKNPHVTRVAHRFSTGLIHAGSITLNGDARKVKQFAKFDDKYKDIMKEFFLSRTTISEEEYTKHEDEEWYLTAQEMLDLGIVDKILEQ